MLAADKDRLVAALKQNALALRQKELDYYVERYSNIATQASIVAGFAFDSLVELEISDDMRAALAPGGRWKAELRWMETVYYGSASLTMALALYTVCVASFATVYGHRLALQGPTGSVERAVAVMMKQRHSIFVTYGLSLLSLVVAAITMSWIKMGVAATFVSGIFLALLLGRAPPSPALPRRAGAVAAHAPSSPSSAHPSPRRSARARAQAPADEGCPPESRGRRLARRLTARGCARVGALPHPSGAHGAGRRAALCRRRARRRLAPRGGLWRGGVCAAGRRAAARPGGVATAAALAWPPARRQQLLRRQRHGERDPREPVAAAAGGSPFGGGRQLLSVAAAVHRRKLALRQVARRRLQRERCTAAAAAPGGAGCDRHAAAALRDAALSFQND